MREIVVPDTEPEAGLLRVAATGICGTDWGKYVRGRFAPCILGHEIVGHVAELGSAARRRWNLKEGDYIALEEYLPCGHCSFCRCGEHRSCAQTDQINAEGVRYGSTSINVPPSLFGGYSQYLYMHPRSVFHRLSAPLLPAMAAMALPIGNGFQWTLRDGGAGPRKTVVIVGPGPQGCACVIAAKAAGAQYIVVVGLARDEHRLHVARRLGATHLVSFDRQNVRAEIEELTSGRMADLVIEVSSAGPEIINACIPLLRRGGRLVCPARKKSWIPLDLDRIIDEGLEIRGVRGHSFAAVELAIRMMSSGRFALEDMVSGVIGLKDVAPALKAIGGKTNHSTIHLAVDPWKEPLATIPEHAIAEDKRISACD